MSEYWKSTPSYWCKFCSQYVRDTGIERKNHEASARHQNNIQRSIRELSKTKEREQRDQDRAKAEVARLNGIVSGGSKKGASSGQNILGVKDLGGKKNVAPPPVPTLSPAEQRKVHAEQLLAMGVQLPPELMKEVTGVGGWETVSHRVVEDERSLADIVKEEQIKQEDTKNGIPLIKGVHKRKVDEEEEVEQSAKRKAWGSRLKQYPGKEVTGDEEDLDALLSGITKKQPTVDEVKKEEPADEVKDEAEVDDKPLSSIPDIDAPAVDVKQEDEAPVVFKKRKVKR